MAFGSANAQHNGLTAREVLISGDYNGNPTPVAVSSTGVLQTASTPGAAVVATTDTATNGTLAALGSFSWTANSNRRSLLIVNTGTTNSIFIKAAATADATGFELKPGAGVKYTDQDGSAQKARTIYSTSGSTYSYEEVIA